MRYTKSISFWITLTLLGFTAMLPILTLAGTFQQVVSGEVTPEIDLRVILASCGMLQVGKTYYWAGDEMTVEANASGPTTGVKEVIETNVRCALYMTFGEKGSLGYRYMYVYDPGTGRQVESEEKYNEFYEKNRSAVTLFFDQDDQFGNGNEIGLIESEKDWTEIADMDRPLLEGTKLYLAVKADSFGHAKYGGKWQIPIAIYAYVK